MQDIWYMTNISYICPKRLPMISTTNPFLFGFSGRAGNMIVKNYGNKIVLSARPNMSNRKLTEKQLELNELMMYANQAAKAVIADPRLKAEAGAALQVPPNKVYRAVVKEFIKRKGEIDDLFPSAQIARYRNTGIDHRHHIEEAGTSVEKPVVKGTEITVEQILQELSKGFSFSELTEKYPSLKMEDILAALAYAAEKV
jgi:uncharacterized protein (DUF433 family)